MPLFVLPVSPRVLFVVRFLVLVVFFGHWLASVLPFENILTWPFWPVAIVLVFLLGPIVAFLEVRSKVGFLRLPSGLDVWLRPYGLVLESHRPLLVGIVVLVVVVVPVPPVPPPPRRQRVVPRTRRLLVPPSSMWQKNIVENFV